MRTYVPFDNPRPAAAHGLAVQQRLVDLLGEETLAADVGERLAEHLVARRLDNDNLERALLGELREARLVVLRAACARVLELRYSILNLLSIARKQAAA